MNDTYYMELAYNEALKAKEENEVPIGVVIVYKDKVIASAHNKKEELKQTIAHAEILAINKANQYFNLWRLDDCIMYVTLEPCIMCSGAIIQSRIKKVVIGARENRWPGLSKILNQYQYNHNVEICFLENTEKCSTIISNYFKAKRNQ